MSTKPFSLPIQIRAGGAGGKLSAGTAAELIAAGVSRSIRRRFTQRKTVLGLFPRAEILISPESNLARL